MSFDIGETIKKLDELENLALMPNEKGEVNLALAVKIEELKAKFAEEKSENEKENNFRL